VSRLTGWTGKIRERRYQAIVVSSEEEAQVVRLKYIFSHGVKELLVAHLREWPGLNSVWQLADGEPLAGTWFDRTMATHGHGVATDVAPSLWQSTSSLVPSGRPIFMIW
jgi:hypothetical protein